MSHLLPPDHALIITLGALAGGFVSGLTGFGTALVSTGILLHVLEPAHVAPLVLICSIAAQLQTIPTIWRDIKPQRVLPFIIPGLAGVPAGVWLLDYVAAGTFRIGAGIFLIAFAAFMLLWRGRPAIAWGGRWADAAAGLLGGILGGLAGLSGPLPTAWATLRGWSKEHKRGVFQAYNLSILSVALAGHIALGHLTWDLLWPVAMALPGTVIGAWAGVTAYHRLNERSFSDVVMALLMVSGLTLLVSFH